MCLLAWVGGPGAADTTRFSRELPFTGHCRLIFSRGCQHVRKCHARAVRNAGPLAVRSVLGKQWLAVVRSSRGRNRCNRQWHCGPSRDIDDKFEHGKTKWPIGDHRRNRRQSDRNEGRKQRDPSAASKPLMRGFSRHDQSRPSRLQFAAQNGRSLSVTRNVAAVLRFCKHSQSRAWETFQELTPTRPCR
jgi:hypothetical protein